MTKPPGQCRDSWERTVDAFFGLEQRRRDLFAACGQNGVASLIQTALNDQTRWGIAIDLLPYVLLEHRLALFPRVLAIACERHALTGRFADAVLAFPKDWLKANIEAVADPLLVSEEQYWQLLKIYQRLDQGLAAKLRAKARSSADPDIRAFASSSGAELE